MLSHYSSLGYRGEANFVRKEDDEFSLEHVDFKVPKKHLSLYTCVSVSSAGCWI